MDLDELRITAEEYFMFYRNIPEPPRTFSVTNPDPSTGFSPIFQERRAQAEPRDNETFGPTNSNDIGNTIHPWRAKEPLPRARRSIASSVYDEDIYEEDVEEGWGHVDDPNDAHLYGTESVNDEDVEGEFGHVDLPHPNYAHLDDTNSISASAFEEMSIVKGKKRTDTPRYPSPTRLDWDKHFSYNEHGNAPDQEPVFSKKGKERIDTPRNTSQPESNHPPGQDPNDPNNPNDPNPPPPNQQSRFSNEEFYTETETETEHDQEPEIENSHDFQRFLRDAEAAVQSYNRKYLWRKAKKGWRRTKKTAKRVRWHAGHGFSTEQFWWMVLHGFK
jgi:hypothetical protein